MVIIILGSICVTGVYLYQNSLQPNIYVVNRIITPVAYPEVTTWLNLGRVSGMGSFNYEVNMSGEYVLIFDNGFSTFSSKSINLTYTTHWPDYQWDYFILSPGQTRTVQIHVNAGQWLGGDFWVSGGSGNDVDFKILAHTCTTAVSFTSSLVNAGTSDGFVDVAFTVDGASAWSNRYFVPKGGTVPIDSHVVLDDCGDHAFDIVVQNQFKP